MTTKTTPGADLGLTCPSCKGAGGECWRGLPWANCAFCHGVGELKIDHPYWAAVARFARQAAA